MLDFQFITYDAPGTLAPLLRSSFFARGQIRYKYDKILPNGLVVAVFNLGQPHRVGKSDEGIDNPSFAHSWLHGVQISPIYNMPGGETHVLGLLFEPIGFHALFGTDMRRLTDCTFEAREVLPASAITIIEKTLGHAEDRAAHDRLHRALMRFDGPSVPPWLWTLYGQIKAGDGDLNLDTTYRSIGLSPRHINARFKRAVGVSPKVLCRIYRLQALLTAIDPSGPVNWTKLAHAFGFYDQPHFNREFRRFAGLHPRQFLAQRQRDLPELGKGDSVHFAPQR